MEKTFEPINKPTPTLAQIKSELRLYIKVCKDEEERLEKKGLTHSQNFAHAQLLAYQTMLDKIEGREDFITKKGSYYYEK